MQTQRRNKKQKKQKKTYLLSAVGKGDNEENPKMADWKRGGLIYSSWYEGLMRTRGVVRMYVSPYSIAKVPWLSKPSKQRKSCIDPKTQYFRSGSGGFIDASLRFGPEAPRYFTKSKENVMGENRFSYKLVLPMNIGYRQEKAIWLMAS